MTRPLGARLESAEIFNLARGIDEIDHLRISGEERNTVRGCSCEGEAVPKCDRRSRLQAGHLQHPGCPRKVCCEHGTKAA